MGNQQYSQALTSRHERPSNDWGLFRNTLFCGLALTWLALFCQRLYLLVGLALRSDPYSYTIAIPFVSLALVYWRRKEIFSTVEFDAVLAALFFILGALLCWLGLKYASVISPLNGLPVTILLFVDLIIGSFALCYGPRALRLAAFPLLFLLLMIPIPTFAVDRIISALQHWSADGTAILYNVFRVPVHRNGLFFELPGVRIVVAEECSGIHSTLALFITVLLLAQFSLKSNWRKLLLCILVVPIAVAKNSIRIFTLSALAVYVNKDFLYGRLHHQGGVLFFLLGLALSMGFLELLGLWERRTQRGSLHSKKNSEQAVPQTSAIC
jgi:exosortase